MVVMAGFFIQISSPAVPVTFKPSNVEPPAVRREFRAAWVATVANIDWPSKPGLPVDQQKAEMIALLDRAQSLNLNAILLQVRPAADALYPSKYEPWSYYLTGVEGNAPVPFYDPLAYAIEQAHLRGIELHAWFNPFRASHPSLKSSLPTSHISKTHPGWVRSYGPLLWIDPGEKDAREYVLKIVMDVVKRYDLDGVVFDDYYYPYKEKDAKKKEIEFPDNLSWKKYGAYSKLSRDDWRRENVNSFVRSVYTSIKSTKPWVKFGVSPFGIWQPGYPAQIRGLNSYSELYSDSRKWLMEGWLDYCAPQLYWSLDSKEQNFVALLTWWKQQNVLGRHLWPGLSDDRVGGMWKPQEIYSQARIVRSQLPESSGVAHWSIKAFAQNHDGLATGLANGIYSEIALVPASPWLDSVFPAKPKLSFDEHGVITWKASIPANISHWLVQMRTGGHWSNSLVQPGHTRESPTDSTDVICITAIDKCGVASPSACMERVSVSGSSQSAALDTSIGSIAPFKK
jgi:uncharacterized lipoprotein YddW (UPF0748 family)